MSANNAAPGSGAPAKDKPAKNGTNGTNGNSNGKKELKILMLHGYTQSGTLFRAKTGALSKMLTKAFGPIPYNLAPSLVYPTGPHRLRPSDIPGYQPPVGQEADDEETDNWGWFRRDAATGTYRGFEQGMQRVAETIKEAGGMDGVIGFSQGGATAALVAAALETERNVPEAAASWAIPLREANENKPLKFCVIYSGFYARDNDLAWMYEGKIQTPSLHFIGGLDTVVEESKSRGLEERCNDPVVVVHPGGHYVPVNKEWVGMLVGFLRNVLVEKKPETAEASL